MLHVSSILTKVWVRSLPWACDVKTVRESLPFIWISQGSRDYSLYANDIRYFFKTKMSNLWINKKSQFSIHKFYLKYAIKVHVSMSQKKYQDY
jgi:hypothetical protein